MVLGPRDTCSTCTGRVYGHRITLAVSHEMWLALAGVSISKRREALAGLAGAAPRLDVQAMRRAEIYNTTELLLREAQRLRRLQNAIARHGAYGSRGAKRRDVNMDRAGVPAWEQAVIRQLGRERKILAQRGARMLARAGVTTTQRAPARRKRGSKSRGAHARPKRAGRKERSTWSRSTRARSASRG